MGFLKLLEATVKIVTLPLDIIQDVGSELMGEDGNKTKKKLDSIEEDIDEIGD